MRPKSTPPRTQLTGLYVEVNTIASLKELTTVLHKSQAQIITSLARAEILDDLRRRSKHLIRWKDRRGACKVAAFRLPTDVRQIINSIAYEMRMAKGELVDKWVSWKLKEVKQKQLEGLKID